MSFHDQQYSEKRDYMRMQVQATAVMKLPELGETLAVQCHDLSSQGMQATSELAVAPGTAVEVSIPSPNPHLPGLEAKGSVVRCSEDEAGRHILGVQFDSLG
ncbi:PilZ domain-containing protein [Halopseudomonas xinjiangensis]|uniref:PilZ domain-containing protein n=1 Tax=Halopseudomonas xinjiangensis TaxID=487184 RepID=A0A1H1SE05_9GAMM|nr:PilZ domain-containing protein [Halopseudomonas xinjiangensis]SDS46103.1 PilZ domain-containing protein [Halopseudomonas xinjiangensis]